MNKVNQLLWVPTNEHLPAYGLKVLAAFKSNNINDPFGTHYWHSARRMFTNGEGNWWKRTGESAPCTDINGKPVQPDYWAVVNPP